MNTQHTTGSALANSAAPYLTFLEEWQAQLQPTTSNPSQAAVLVVDMIEGFVEHGPLASPRVARIVAPVSALLEAYNASGGSHVLLPEDSHVPDSREFRSYPPHAIAGTSEARTVAALKAIERPSWKHFPKQTLNALGEPAVQREVFELLASGIRDFVVIGDCTDLCVYQTAMALQIMLNRPEHAAYRDARIIVPASAVDTYDFPVELARNAGAQPHPAELLHATFLHHMALNSVTVCTEVRWAA
ncbi:MAG: nicotinamidase-like amidase [Chloroflexi bacterium]|nr:nicotinamidase-like amidase [Chloroflexota bacterium]